jgi:hypothetical protein
MPVDLTPALTPPSAARRAAALSLVMLVNSAYGATASRRKRAPAAAIRIRQTAKLDTQNESP